MIERVRRARARLPARLPAEEVTGTEAAAAVLPSPPQHALPPDYQTTMLAWNTSSQVQICVQSARHSGQLSGHCYSPDALGFSKCGIGGAVFLGRAEVMIPMQLMNLILNIQNCQHFCYQHCQRERSFAYLVSRIEGSRHHHKQQYTIKGTSCRLVPAMFAKLLGSDSLSWH